MKSFKHFALTVLVALVSSLSANAYDFEVDGIYYYETSDNTVAVTWGDTKYSGDVVIPSSVTYSGRTYSITKIGDYAFYECSSLTSIEILNSTELQLSIA